MINSQKLLDVFALVPIQLRPGKVKHGTDVASYYSTIFNLDHYSFECYFKNIICSKVARLDSNTIRSLKSIFGLPNSSSLSTLIKKIIQIFIIDIISLIDHLTKFNNVPDTIKHCNCDIKVLPKIIIDLVKLINSSKRSHLIYGSLRSVLIPDGIEININSKEYHNSIIHTKEFIPAIVNQVNAVNDLIKFSDRCVINNYSDLFELSDNSFNVSIKRIFDEKHNLKHTTILTGVGHSEMDLIYSLLVGVEYIFDSQVAIRPYKWQLDINEISETLQYTGDYLNELETVGVLTNLELESIVKSSTTFEINKKLEQTNYKSEQTLSVPDFNIKSSISPNSESSNPYGKSPELLKTERMSKQKNLKNVEDREVVDKEKED